MLLRSVQSGCRSFHWASCYHCRWCFRWCRQRDRHLRSKRSASFSSRQVRIPRRALQRPQEIDIPTPGLFASANSPCLVHSTLGHHQHLITAVLAIWDPVSPVGALPSPIGMERTGSPNSTSCGRCGFASVKSQAVRPSQRRWCLDINFAARSMKKKRQHRVPRVPQISASLPEHSFNTLTYCYISRTVTSIVPIDGCSSTRLSSITSSTVGIVAPTAYLRARAGGS